MIIGGGNGWSGATTCVSGAYCKLQNEWYSQCIPGNADPVPSPDPTPEPVPTVVPVPTASPPAPTVIPAPNPADPGTCPALPGSITLKSNAKLPDPFTFISGAKVTTKADWECRRQELYALFDKYESGTLPPKPSGFTAKYSGGTLSLTATEGGKSISFTASISGNSGTGMGAIIGIGGSSIGGTSGLASITFNNNDMAAQDNTGSRGRGKFYTLYGSGHSASAMVAWAWGVGRIIDGLEITTGHNIDVKKLAVSGCSRNGKGALAVGVLEQRIALTIPQESGSGGAACWRLSDKMKSQGLDTQTASQIVTENVWFSKNLEPYVNKVNDLPFDHHMWAGLVAPRGLLIIENTKPDWLGPHSCWGCMNNAWKIYQALGVPDNMGISQVGPHDHCSFPSSQTADVTAFVNKFLKGQTSNTAIKRITDTTEQNWYSESAWVDWTVPTLT